MDWQIWYLKTIRNRNEVCRLSIVVMSSRFWADICLRRFETLQRALKFSHNTYIHIKMFRRTRCILTTEKFQVQAFHLTVNILSNFFAQIEKKHRIRLDKNGWLKISVWEHTLMLDMYVVKLGRWTGFSSKLSAPFSDLFKKENWRFYFRIVIIEGVIPFKNLCQKIDHFSNTMTAEAVWSVIAFFVIIKLYSNDFAHR